MPYEPVSLGLKFAIRLEHLTVRDVVVITCAGCHRRWNVPPYRLLERYHAYKLIQTLEQDMKCRRCGPGTKMHWYIIRAAGPEFPRSA